jgi:hypothetical protein
VQPVTPAERLNGLQEVSGSIPLIPIKVKRETAEMPFFFDIARLAKLGTTSWCKSGRGKSQVAS